MNSSTWIETISPYSHQEVPFLVLLFPPSRPPNKPRLLLPESTEMEYDEGDRVEYLFKCICVGARPPLYPTNPDLPRCDSLAAYPVLRSLAAIRTNRPPQDPGVGKTSALKRYVHEGDPHPIQSPIPTGFPVHQSCSRPSPGAPSG